MPTPTPAEITALRQSFASARSLPRSSADPGSNCNSRGPFLASIDDKSKPTFRRLFTHDTWRLHLGGSTLARWTRCMRATPGSIILRAIWRAVASVACYAAAVSLLLDRYCPRYGLQTLGREQQLPLSLCGSAIGLLLVFRTNNAYTRLEEARELWGRVVHVNREIVATVVSAWSVVGGDGDGDGKRGTTKEGVETAAVASVCRYLTAHAYALRDELRDGDTRTDILRSLLPPEEASWVATQRSRPLALRFLLRRALRREEAAGRMPEHFRFVLQGDLRDLGLVASSCERLFSSPIPPTMSRHGLRSLTLWLLALPFVLAGTVPPLVNVLWTAALAFVYLGIDELGVQVEQPFQLIPLWQLCRVVQDDIEELVVQALEFDTMERNRGGFGAGSLCGA